MPNQKIIIYEDIHGDDENDGLGYNVALSGNNTVLAVISSNKNGIGYIKIYRKGLHLKEVRKAFTFPNSKMNFFPVMEKEWKKSFL